MADDTRPNIFPALSYRDGEAALDWLQRAFGFSADSVHRDGEGRIVHAEMRLGAGHIMFGTAREEPGNPWARPGIGIYVKVGDIDAHHAAAQAAGAEIVRPLADTPYGSREYSVRDPDGNLWSFGTYGPGDA